MMLRASSSFVTSDNKFATIHLSYVEDSGISSLFFIPAQFQSSVRNRSETSIPRWGRSHERRSRRILRRPRIEMTAFLSLFLFLLPLLLLYQSSSTGVCSAIRSVRAGSKLHSHAHRPWNTGCEMQLLHASLAGVLRICKGPSLRPH